MSLPAAVVCPRCAGPRWIVGAVTEPHAVRRWLTTLGLAAEPPLPGMAVAPASEALPGPRANVKALTMNTFESRHLPKR